ncbi:thioredoxin-like protein [Mycena polygramma]|nr:thioredoxin-like protein [Mycena polygramma]
MAILKLYGSKLATCTRRTATILHELKVPFELIEINLQAGEHKTPEYLEKQPFGQIPYIICMRRTPEDDDGFLLYETRAICHYIAAKHPESGLIPTEPKANALFEQAAAVEVTNLTRAVIDEHVPILDKKLDGYERILAKHRYIAGDKLTLADLFHLPYGPLSTLGGSDMFTRRPNVARWYEELVARPSWLAYQVGVTTTTTY